MIDKRRLRKIKLVSWGFTLMGVFNIIALFLVASLIAIELRGPGAFLAVVMPMMAFACGSFILGEPLVNLMLGAETPDPVKDKRFLDSMERQRRKARMWIRPRAWIVSLGGMPNAMAYGPGIPGMCAVGISRELVDMLNDDELDGVIGHEYVHIKNRDTGLLALIGMIRGSLDKLGKTLSNPALAAEAPLLWIGGHAIKAIGRVIFFVSQFSISQEREIAADAGSAGHNGDSAPLISALTKLHTWFRTHRGDDPRQQSVFRDLMVAHPGLEERIASLRSIMADEAPVTLLLAPPAQQRTSTDKEGAFV